MIKEEAVGAKPFYRPGDVITNIYGCKGVIVEAEVVVDGMVYEWNNCETPPSSEHGYRPQYAIEWFTEPQGEVDWDEMEQWKYAWWEAHEWADVELGLTHSKQEKRNENHDG